MKVLILGGTGMLGHQMHDVLSERHDVVSTTRAPLSALGVDGATFFRRGRLIEGIDVTELPKLEGLVAELGPEAVVNCVGIVKQRDEANDPLPSVAVNALFPHQLARLCETNDARLIHFSTDCVFSGAKGDYTEDDASDAGDLYGRTKYLGEVTGQVALTLRTSMIGRELDHFRSLVEWFLRQRGEVMGFTRAIYTGITTRRMANVVNELLLEHPSLGGLYQVASAKISKYDLLSMIRERFAMQELVSLVPDDSVVCDRSLLGTRFEADTGITIPSWDRMVEALAYESERYRSVTM